MSKIQVLAFSVLVIAFITIAKLLSPLTQQELAFMFFLAAFIIMLLGYNVPKARTMLVSIGFFVLTSAGFTGFSNWLPQVRGEAPPPPLNCSDPKVKKEHAEECSKTVDTMSVDELAKMGEFIIFGPDGEAKRGQGKGQCGLCHGFKAGEVSERAPNLTGIGSRAAERIKDPRYLQPNFVQTESFKGSGRATTAEEYIAESHSCPSCFVVQGFGVKGSNDRESPMNIIHKPPMSLSIDEQIAVDTFLFVRDGMEPPPVSEIRAAYEKFIPESDRPKPAAATAVAEGDPCAKIACASDTPEQIIGKMGCAACHKVPSIEFAKTGAIGPMLAEGANAPFRIKSPEYQAAVKAGKAHATTPKEYIIESIMDPSAFIAHGFEPLSPGGKSLMPADFATKFTYAAVSKLADFLLEQDAKKAKAQGLTQHPMEKHKIM
ncbi:MAG: nitric oxide reductase [Nitrospirota bacterium]